MMGFFDSLGKAIGSGVRSIQDSYVEQVLKNMRGYENDSRQDLMDLLANVEARGTKMAIILSIAEKNDVSGAIQAAKDNAITKKSFEPFFNSPIGRTAKEIVKEWDR